MKLSFASLLDCMSRQFEMLRVVSGFMVHLRADFLLDISILLEARKVRFRINLCRFFQCYCSYSYWLCSVILVVLCMINSANIHVLFMFVCVIVGWEPKTFVSSRSQRYDTGTQQKPEDFMDEEVAVDSVKDLCLKYLLICVCIWYYGHSCGTPAVKQLFTSLLRRECNQINNISVHS